MTRAVVRVKAIIATGLMTLAAAGCSTSHLVAGRPTAANPGTPVALPQVELLPHFFAEPDPMHVLKRGSLQPPSSTNGLIRGHPGIHQPAAGSGHFRRGCFPQPVNLSAPSGGRGRLLAPCACSRPIRRWRSCTARSSCMPGHGVGVAQLGACTHQSPGGWAVFLTKDQLMLLRNPMPS
jgi:hypothetical protein